MPPPPEREPLLLTPIQLQLAQTNGIVDEANERWILVRQPPHPNFSQAASAGGFLEYDQRRTLLCLALGETAARRVVTTLMKDATRWFALTSTFVSCFVLVLLGFIQVVPTPVLIAASCGMIFVAATQFVCAVDLHIFWWCCLRSFLFWANAFLIVSAMVCFAYLVAWDARGICAIVVYAVGAINLPSVVALPCDFRHGLVVILSFNVLLAALVCILLNFAVIPRVSVPLIIYEFYVGGHAVIIEALSVFNAFQGVIIGLAFSEIIHYASYSKRAHIRVWAVPLEKIDVFTFVDYSYLERSRRWLGKDVPSPSSPSPTHNGGGEGKA